MVARAAPEVRFARYVDLNGPVNAKTGTRCHLWTGWTQPDGRYGLFQFSARKKVLAHRFAYECANGPIPEGMWIDHDDLDVGCHIRLCVNAEHLRAVTPLESRASQGVGRNGKGAARGTCTLCGRPHDSHGLCKAHAQQKRRREASCL